MLVGTYHGKTGQYASIQAAVDAAQSGDWILVAPGDYHEADDTHVTSTVPLSTGDHGGVVVTTSDIHIRGLNRNTVVVDGTKAGLPTMANPYAGVPPNAWCASGSALGTTTRHDGNGGHAAVAPIEAGVAYRRSSL